MPSDQKSIDDNADKKPKTEIANRGKKLIRFVCPDQVTVIKHQLVFDSFQTIFEQFPKKIAELKKLKAQDQFRVGREDILTDCRIFSVPPSLNQIKSEQEQAQSKLDSKQAQCNCNRQSQVYLNYDGYIKANEHLEKFVTKLESYYDFYSNWWNQLYYAVVLMKPQMQEENNLQSEIQDSTVSFISDICSKINGMSPSLIYLINVLVGFIDSVDVCLERFNNILKIQQFPHVDDYRQDLAIFERETWFELCLITQMLYSYYLLTYDCVAKNFHKLI